MDKVNNDVVALSRMMQIIDRCPNTYISALKSECLVSKVPQQTRVRVHHFILWAEWQQGRSIIQKCVQSEGKRIRRRTSQKANKSDCEPRKYWQINTNENTYLSVSFIRLLRNGTQHFRLNMKRNQLTNELGEVYKESALKSRIYIITISSFFRSYLQRLNQFDT